MICDLAYRTLSHPSIKEKRINDIVFQILGMAIKNYAHAIAFPVQITHILEREEIAVVPIARGIVFLHDEFHITTVLEVMLKEFIERVDATAQTSLIPKHFSMFITEIGDLSSELAFECLQMADEILNLEPFNIRNSLFVMMGNVIIGQLVGEGLSDELKETRDELLEHLLEHVSDVNSYVRSKVLHVWSDLETQHAIPLAWKLKVAQAGVERLEDKTATVRKNAITLLKLILESNPFSCKVSSIEEIFLYRFVEFYCEFRCSYQLKRSKRNMMKQRKKGLSFSKSTMNKKLNVVISMKISKQDVCPSWKSFSKDY